MMDAAGPINTNIVCLSHCVTKPHHHFDILILSANSLMSAAAWAFSIM